MKTLAEQISLKGQSERITLSELRSKPGEVFSQVEMGKEFEVSKAGKVVAKITPPQNFDWQALQMLRRISK